MDDKVNNGVAETPAENPKDSHVKPTHESKKSLKEQRKVDDKSVEQVLKALNSLQSPEEKLAAMCKKYAEIVDENRKVSTTCKQWEKKYVLNQREKEQLQLEYNKTVLLKAKLESLCRELQKQNKAVKDESLVKIREEEERRKETQAKFQNTLTEITTLMQQNYEKNTKLRDDNIDMTKKFKSVVEQYELREQQVEKMAKQMSFESQLSEAKLNKANFEAQLEKEKLLLEKKQLLQELTQYQARCTEMQYTEVDLRRQVSMYTDKYDEFQNALTKSNEVFGGFKGEMEKMSKKIQKLEKETTMWKQRWEKSHAALLDMAAEKQQRDMSSAHQNRQLRQLQKLCRTMQAERSSLLGALKDNNIERPPLPVLPAEPEVPAAEPVDKVDAMAAYCTQLKQSLSQLQGQLDVLTSKSGSEEPEAQATSKPNNAPIKKNFKKGKGKKGKPNDAKDAELSLEPAESIETSKEKTIAEKPSGVTCDSASQPIGNSPDTAIKSLDSFCDESKSVVERDDKESFESTLNTETKPIESKSEPLLVTPPTPLENSSTPTKPLLYASAVAKEKHSELPSESSKTEVVSEIVSEPLELACEVSSEPLEVSCETKPKILETINPLDVSSEISTKPAKLASVLSTKSLETTKKSENHPENKKGNKNTPSSPKKSETATPSTPESTVTCPKPLPVSVEFCNKSSEASESCLKTEVVTDKSGICNKILSETTNLEKPTLEDCKKLFSAENLKEQETSTDSPIVLSETCKKALEGKLDFTNAKLPTEICKMNEQSPKPSEISCGSSQNPSNTSHVEASITDSDNSNQIESMQVLSENSLNACKKSLPSSPKNCKKTDSKKSAKFKNPSPQPSEIHTKPLEQFPDTKSLEPCDTVEKLLEENHPELCPLSLSCLETLSISEPLKKTQSKKGKQNDAKNSLKKCEVPQSSSEIPDMHTDLQDNDTKCSSFTEAHESASTNHIIPDVSNAAEIKSGNIDTCSKEKNLEALTECKKNSPKKKRPGTPKDKISLDETKVVPSDPEKTESIEAPIAILTLDVDSSPKKDETISVESSSKSPGSNGAGSKKRGGKKAKASCKLTHASEVLSSDSNVLNP